VTRRRIRLTSLAVFLAMGTQAASTSSIGSSLIRRGEASSVKPPVRNNAVSSYDAVPNGIVFCLRDSTLLKVEVCADDIIRVVHTPKTSIPDARSLVVVRDSWGSVQWKRHLTQNSVSLITSRIEARVALSNGSVTFYDAQGRLVLGEKNHGRALLPVTIQGQAAYSGILQFDSPREEGIYGFGHFPGSPGDGKLDQRNVELTLVQENTRDAVPVFLSTRGYGVLLHTYSRIDKHAPLDFTIDWLWNDAIDYYFMYGPGFDRVISSYRFLTWAAPLFPKWAYGLWLSRCRAYWHDQKGDIDVVRKHRELKIPIDNFVKPIREPYSPSWFGVDVSQI